MSMFKRTVEAGAKRAADESLLELSFSSEAPYERWFGIEILRHAPESIDLSRLADGRHPFLVGHDFHPDDIIDAGGIASEEAVGQPYLTFESEPTVEPGFGGHPRRAPAPHRIVAAGGIASAEAFGRPTASAGVRSRARRAREMNELRGHFLP